MEYGKKVTINQDVKFIGKGEDPKNNIGFKMWEDGLTNVIKVNYLTEKRMKKLYGKNLGRQIAYGRRLVKMTLDIYKKP